MKIKQDEYTVPPLWLLEREGLTAAEFSEARTVLVNCRLSLCDDERNGHSGRIHSPPGRKPPAQLRINTVTEPAVGISRAPPSLALASATALQPAWVIFRKYRWVSSGARRSFGCLWRRTGEYPPARLLLPAGLARGTPPTDHPPDSR